MTLRKPTTGEDEGEQRATQASIDPAAAAAVPAKSSVTGSWSKHLRPRNLFTVIVVAVATLTGIGGIDGQEPFQPTFAPNSPGFSVAEETQTPPTPSTNTSVVDDASATPDQSEAQAQVETEVEVEVEVEAPTEPIGGPGPSEALVDQNDSAPLACLQSSAGGDVWQLVFADDFDGEEVDQSDWYLYDSPGNAGFGLRRPAAITVEDGLLVLTAEMIDGVLVSGGMAHRSDQIYGRWEFRVRTDPDPSEATSGVVLTWPGSDNWPIDGENDMYETERRADRTPFRTYIHYGADNSQEYLTHDADGTEWHDMAMEWTADRITMFRDGAYVGEITSDEVIPDVPHHMTVQLDAWADEMGDPVRMYVDWVRVYRLDDAAASC